MSASEIAARRTRDRIATTLHGIEFEDREVRDGTPCIVVEAAVLHEVLERLKDQAGFESATFITAVDLDPQEPRFEVNHQLWSLEHNDSMRVKTLVSEESPKVPSCIDIWPGASFMERECFDMFGIVFEGHPDLRRLLMPEGYGHHPLRKEFPHQGIEPDRLYREWDQRRRAEWSPEESQP